jgi:type IX secretion system PorP/SprF family membrane protein
MALGHHAQQNPQFSQYLQNPFVLNPAMTGVEDYIDLNASYRQQWTGLEGAPRTTTFSLNSPLNLINGELQPHEGETHQGLGAFFYTDNVGPIKQGAFYASYAYHLKVSQEWFVALGTFVGATQFKFDDSDVVLIQTPNDALVQNFSEVNFDMSLGLYVYSKYLFAGIAAHQIFNNSIRPTAINNQLNTNGTLAPNFNALLGSRIALNETLDVVPHLLLKTVASAPLRWDIGTKMVYNNNVWGGLSYRHEDALVGFFGLRLFENAMLSYSYDWSLTRFSNQQSGSHEIILGYRFNFGKQQCTCPKYTL